MAPGRAGDHHGLQTCKSARQPLPTATRRTNRCQRHQLERVGVRCAFAADRVAIKQSGETVGVQHRDTVCVSRFSSAALTGGAVPAGGAPLPPDAPQRPL